MRATVYAVWSKSRERPKCRNQEILLNSTKMGKKRPLLIELSAASHPLILKV